LAPAPTEEVVPFSDYGPQFRVEAQSENPRVKCFDLRRLTTWTTPSDEFFAFHQTQVPQALGGNWRLRIGGLVRRTGEYSVADLMSRADRREVAVTVECSGNIPDARIMNGLVSTAIWTGIPLATLLHECGVAPEAREVVFLGLDAELDKKWEAGNAEYLSPHGYSIFTQDAQSAGPLLAFAMNGQPLPVEHGYPLLLILPGWYGMAQVKWLTRIELIDHRYEGRHMARNYQSLRAVKAETETLWLDTSISRNNLKSVIARVIRRRLDEGFAYRIAGAAWGGPAPIQSVEIRIDDGEWRPARILERHSDAAWLLWSFDWAGAGTAYVGFPRHQCSRRNPTHPRGTERPPCQQSRRQFSVGAPRGHRVMLAKLLK
jgi:DMSO/TMAO reductase YedYZ molybdopterin-dependent catalytic subunit